jgi:FkbM family methyltransferase
MLIPVEELSTKFSICPGAILHVGAHLGEEREEYLANGWGRNEGILWIEAQKDLCEILSRKFDNSFPSESVINALVWNMDGTTKPFYISNSTQSSSMLAFGDHSKLYPSVKTIDQIELQTSRLDSLIMTSSYLKRFDFVNLDIQGVELQALEGMDSLLLDVTWIYTEVNFDEIYRDCSRVFQIDEYLSGFGFKRLLTRKAVRGGWGDALYVKNASPNLKFRCFRWSLRETFLEIHHKVTNRFQRFLQTCGG